MKKILIVEDDPALLRGLKDNFEARGYHVSTANDGQRGLVALLNDPPDLLILDLMLPHVNGYEICRTARARHRDMPIIMLTAKSQEEDIFRGLTLGADDYVTKPFDIRDLIGRAEALGWLQTDRFPGDTPHAGSRRQIPDEVAAKPEIRT